MTEGVHLPYLPDPPPAFLVALYYYSNAVKRVWRPRKAAHHRSKGVPCGAFNGRSRRPRCCEGWGRNGPTPALPLAPRLPLMQWWMLGRLGRRSQGRQPDMACGGQCEAAPCESEPATARQSEEHPDAEELNVTPERVRGRRSLISGRARHTKLLPGETLPALSRQSDPRRMMRASGAACRRRTCGPPACPPAAGRRRQRRRVPPPAAPRPTAHPPAAPPAWPGSSRSR